VEQIDFAFTAMTSDRPRSSLSVWLIVAVALPALYMLSTGPVIVLVNLGFLPKFVLSIYWPLAVLRDNSRLANVFFAWYESLWFRINA
jgi:hypothetical protein